MQLSSSIPDNNKIFNRLIYVTAVLVFIYVALRAYLISLTTDEEYSFYYFVVKENLFYSNYEFMTANNHLLNSLLMWCAYKLFGCNIFMLRFPNVIAFAVYLFYTIKLIRNINDGFFRLSIFILLCSNPFLLDFFSLARGYGISMAFLVAALYHMLLFYSSTDHKKIFSALLFIAIGALANFTLWYVFFPMCLLFIIEIFRKPDKVKVKESLWAIVFILGSLFYSAYILYHMNKAGSLFYGGIIGIWYDTINSILFMSLYYMPYSLNVHLYIKIFIALCFIPGLAFMFRDLFKKTKNYFSLYEVLLCLFMLIICFEITLHKLLDVKYLVGRTGLFFIPIVYLVCGYFLDEKIKNKLVRITLSAIIISSCTAHFLYCMSLDRVLLWK